MQAFDKYLSPEPRSNSPSGISSLSWKNESF